MLVRWGGKLLQILQQIYSGNSVTNFISIAQVLWKILQKNILVSFFQTHCISRMPTIHFCVCVVLLSYKTLSMISLPDHVTWGSPERLMVLTFHRNSTTPLPGDVKSVVFQSNAAALQKYIQIHNVLLYHCLKYAIVIGPTRVTWRE